MIFINLLKKHKNVLLLVLKIAVVMAAFGFIFSQLRNNKQLDWVQFAEQFKTKNLTIELFLMLFLSVANRFLEILKWQNLVESIQKISLFEATKQVLAALTLGIFTPNGIGEYAGKALYFDKSQTKNVVFLNLICNGIQMVLSVFFGLIGLVFFNLKFHFLKDESVIMFFLILLILVSILFMIKNKTVAGFSIHKFYLKMMLLPKKIHFKNVLLGTARYLVFSHQYYFLFVVFGVQLPYLMIMAAITSVYFLASALPTFQFLDFAVKGSVAVFFFNYLGINQWIVVFVSTLIWFFNVVLPVIFGCYFVLTFKTEKK